MPAALGVIMLGLGLSLTIADFTRVLVYPRAVFVGLFCQMLVLPVVCFFIVKAFGLAPALAVGMILLAASPGGVSANLYSHLSHGDVALNITLTAVNSVLTLLSIPFFVNLALVHFMGEGKVLPLQFSKMIQVFVIVLGPVAIGMVIRRYAPGFANTMEKPVKIMSALLLVLVIVILLYGERSNVGGYIKEVGLAALCFNVISMLIGYFLPTLVNISKRQRIAIGMEIGIHNGTLAIAIATSPFLLNNTAMAVPAAVYGILMFFTAAAFGYIVNRKHAPETTASAATN
ncbi:MAG: bile acid:sodium symporter family protein [Nevskiales bacterium]